MTSREVRCGSRQVTLAGASFVTKICDRRFSVLPKLDASLFLVGITPGRSRTCDLRFRKPSLYPSELREHANAIIEFLVSASRFKETERRAL